MGKQAEKITRNPAWDVVARLGFAHLDFLVPCESRDHCIRVSPDGYRVLDHSVEDYVVQALGSSVQCLEACNAVRLSPKQVAWYEEYCDDPRAPWISGMVSRSASAIEESPCDPSLVPQALRRLTLICLAGPDRVKFARRLASKSLERLAATNDEFGALTPQARDEILERVDESWLNTIWLLGIDVFDGGFPAFWHDNTDFSAKIEYWLAEKGFPRLEAATVDLQRLAPNVRWSTSRWSPTE